MKRPFCILALSDLHLRKTDSVNILAGLEKSIVDFLETSPQWIPPDFLVISGDLIDAREANYDLARQVIQLFQRSFHISSFRVIVTPGNHEKSFPGFPKNGTKAEKKKFWEEEMHRNERFASFIDKSDDYKVFRDDKNPNFERFGQFYLPYLRPGKKECRFFGPSLDIKDPAARTSYLKVFPEHKVCFLSVNTEWTDIPFTFKKLLSVEQVAELEALPKICRPVVYEQLKEFKTRYADYTLITVMHRDPAKLSWMELSAAQVDRPDIAQFLFHHSDIIFSGHDHIKRVVTPHLLGNRAQSFQLGSPCMDDRGGGDWSHRMNAGLLLVDSIGHTVRFQQFYHEKSSIDYQWQAIQYPKEEGEPCYPLVCKHLNPDTSGRQFPEDHIRLSQLDNVLTLHANSLDAPDVEAAFRQQMPVLNEKEYDLEFINLDGADYLRAFEAALSKSSSEKRLLVLYGSTFIRETLPSQYHNRFYEVRNLLLADKHSDLFYNGKVSLFQVFIKTRYPFFPFF